MWGSQEPTKEGERVVTPKEVFQFFLQRKPLLACLFSEHLFLQGTKKIHLKIKGITLLTRNKKKQKELK